MLLLMTMQYFIILMLGKVLWIIFGPIGFEFVYVSVPTFCFADTLDKSYKSITNKTFQKAS